MDGRDSSRLPIRLMNLSPKSGGIVGTSTESTTSFALGALKNKRFFVKFFQKYVAKSRYV